MTLPLAALLQGAVAGGPTGQTYVDDVFSTYLYTGNGSTQTINNGIDLAGKGGLVLLKVRIGTAAHFSWYDTERGTGKILQSGTTSAQITAANTLTAFNSNGFSIGSSENANINNESEASWTFRKAPKFFDVQTKSHTNGVASTVDLSTLGTVGQVIVKRTDSTGSWYVWHRSLTSGYNILLESTAAEFNTNAYLSVSGTTLTIASGMPTGTYVVYGLAHDTSADGIIQCGSFTTDGSGNATVNLGWEPQFLQIKNSQGVVNWYQTDVMMGSSNTSSYYVYPNSSAADPGPQSNAGKGYFVPTATGFQINGLTASNTHIYLAIRRPNMPPTSGTQVYNAIAYTANDTDGRKLSGIGFPPDLVSIDPRSSYTTPGGPNWFSRLTGNGRFLTTASTSAELDGSSNSNGILGQDDFTVSRFGTNVWSNVGSYLYILHAFRRAPGVFDVVCYTGTGVVRTVAHNLGVAPELMIVKKRSAAGDWYMYLKSLGNTGMMLLQTNEAAYTGQGVWNSTSPTSTVFSVSSGGTNTTNETYIAHLFATCPGVSKVFSFTGNGTNQNIECGFTTGARFVLLKRTDSTGNWLVADTARGIVAGDDPSLALNSTAAEVTTVDWIDPYSGGFNVVQESTNNANVNNATYIGIAFA